MPRSIIWINADEVESYRAAWDRRVGLRGDQADIYDSACWLGARLAVADPESRRRLLVPALQDGEKLVALWPLELSGARAATVPGAALRPRARIVADDLVSIEPLVAAIAERGIVDLELPAMPTRDPSTELLIDALRRERFQVATRPGPEECLARALGSWDEHRRQFKKFERTIKNFSNKSERLGALQFDASERADFELYRALHGAGWKGALREPMGSHRRALFERASSDRLLRQFTMTLEAVPCATLIAFRIGAVAILYSTVYDQRFAALSSGTIAIWRALERLQSEPGVAWIDYLPGHGAQKDQLATERPRLLTIEATRRAAIFQVGRRWVGRLSRRLRVKGSAPTTDPTLSERWTIAPQKVAPKPGAATVTPLAEIDATLELFLAVSGSHPSAAAMRSSWGATDRWWRSGDPDSALLRLDGTTVKELVLLSGDPIGAIAAVAGALNQTLEVTSKTVAAKAPLPLLTPGGDD